MTHPTPPTESVDALIKDCEADYPPSIGAIKDALVSLRNTLHAENTRLRGMVAEEREQCALIAMEYSGHCGYADGDYIAAQIRRRGGVL